MKIILTKTEGINFPKCSGDEIKIGYGPDTF